MLVCFIFIGPLLTDPNIVKTDEIVRIKYWRPDVDDTVQLVSRYADAVVVGKRGSERVLQQFLRERRKSVRPLGEVSLIMRIL